MIFNSRGNSLSRLTALPSSVCRCQRGIRQMAKQAVQPVHESSPHIPLAIQSANQLQLTLFYRHLATAVIFSSSGKCLSRLTAYRALPHQQHIRQTARQAVQLSPKVARSIPLALHSKKCYSSHLFTGTSQPP